MRRLGLAGCVVALMACAVGGTEPRAVLSEWQNTRATLTVPLDHDDPGGATIDVPVWRREATDPERRIGVLLVNPGGPGSDVSGLVLRRVAHTEGLRARFDIVAVAPRGSFEETEVDCLPDLARHISSVDWSPETPAEAEILEAYIQTRVDECAARYGDLLWHVSTMDSVRDMALLVEALGEDRVSYFGRSYGTVTGAAFVTEYPDLVRAAVFDAAADPHGDPFAHMRAALVARESFLVGMIEECEGWDGCPIDGPPLEAFARVAAAADDQPLDADPALPPVNREGLAFTLFAGEAAYLGRPGRREIRAVAAADAGDPVPLQELFRDVTELQRGASPSLLAIRCMDWPHRGSAPWPGDALAGLEEAAPTYFEVFPGRQPFDPLVMCEHWPADPDPLPSPPTGDGAGPILVVSATRDPVTPEGSARLLSERLVNDAFLLVDDATHTSYQPESDNPARSCATELIDVFLIELSVPPEGTVCRG